MDRAPQALGLLYDHVDKRRKPSLVTTTYAPQDWTVTVPSGCSQEIVPLDVMVGGAGFPSLPNCTDIVIVQL